ncbi:MAG: MASE3 domain-containing protein [bacterium]
MQDSFIITRETFIRFALILCSGFILLFGLDQYNFLLAHVFAEMFSIAVAWMIFFIAWNGHRYFENSYFAIVGTAYFFVGVLDLVHTISYEGMGVFAGFTANLPTELWINARFIESFALLFALVFINRKISIYGILSVWAVVFLVSLTAVFGGWFPDCYIPGVGLTAFKKGSELFIVALLAAALLLLYKRREYFSKKIIGYIYASMALTIAAEFAFIAYIGVYDLSNLIGHYFKILSFYMMYRGIVVTTFKDPYVLLMQRLQQRNQELEEQRREINRARRISETMLNNIPEEIALLNRKSLEIIDVNKTFLDVHKLTKEEVIGSTCFKITHGCEEPCDDEQHPCPLFKQGDERPTVHTHITSEGEKRFVEVSVWPVYDNDVETDEIVHIVRDITPQKRIEQLRNDVERVVRHDLKSPLNGIIGGTKLLMEYNNCSEDQRSLLEAIHSSGISVLKMIDNSMDLYKMEEGMYQLQRSWFDLGRMFRLLSTRWVSLKAAKKLALVFYVNGSELDTQSECRVYAEEQSIENLLANLIENALEAAPRNSTVTVLAECSESGLHLDVHNQGVIPAEIRQRFFERYVTHGKEHGTGLGTYSAFLITRAHNGTIDFTSDEAEGTHLLVDIPVVENPS